MHVLEADIPTAHASKYLQQLCKHWAHKFAVDFTPLNERVPFPNDTVCVLSADDATLHVRMEAPDAESAARLSGVVIDHLQRFAHREELASPVWRAAA